jgi:hypothetical protein
MKELSLHILDAMENSVEAGATLIKLMILEVMAQDLMQIEIIDNGKGMNPDMVDRVMDPFVTSRTTRHVGLGIPLFAAAARQCEGNLHIFSEPGKGTRLLITFKHSHIDRAPLGDIPTVILSILLSQKPVDVYLKHTCNEKEFVFDSVEVRSELGDISLIHPQVREWILKTIIDGEKSLYDSNLNEH